MENLRLGISELRTVLKKSKKSQALLLCSKCGAVYQIAPISKCRNHKVYHWFLAPCSGNKVEQIYWVGNIGLASVVTLKGRTQYCNGRTLKAYIKAVNPELTGKHNQRQLKGKKGKEGKGRTRDIV